MKALLWKDLRRLRLVLIVAGALLAVPYVLVLAVGFHAEEHGLAWLLYVACHASLWLSVVLGGFIAGIAMAGERSDRSTEFAAILPATRRSAVASKMIVAAGACLLMLLMNLCVLHLTEIALDPPFAHAVPVPTLLGPVVVSLFGVSWLASELSGSPAIGVAAGLGIVAALLAAGAALAEGPTGERCETVVALLFGWWEVHGSYRLLCVVLGLACLAVGAYRDARRIEA
ncbi:MAG: ABC transporter permease [Phycisphaerae bacterium]|nr:ABC transporter permease [Phycisphaerae bacterium]